MAYDSRTAYQAPSRSYHQQSSPQTSYQQSSYQQPSYQQPNGYQAQDSDYYHDQSQRVRDQRLPPGGYAREHEYDNGYGQPQEEQYNDRQPYQQQWAQPQEGGRRSYERGPIQGMRDRNPPRSAGMTGPGQHPSTQSRGPPQQLQSSESAPQFHRQQSGHPRAVPRSQLGPADATYLQGPTERPAPFDRSRSAEQVPRDVGNQSRQQQPAAKKEPRRPLLVPDSPTELPQDNAFPVFPTKKKAARSKPAPAGGDRHSGEQRRPATADGRQHRLSHSQDSGKGDMPQKDTHLQRPPMPPAVNSFDEVLGYARNERAPPGNLLPSDGHMPRPDGWSLHQQQSFERKPPPGDLQRDQGQSGYGQQMPPPQRPQPADRGTPPPQRQQYVDQGIPPPQRPQYADRGTPPPQRQHYADQGMPHPSRQHPGDRGTPPPQRQHHADHGMPPPQRPQHGDRGTPPPQRQQFADQRMPPPDHMANGNHQDMGYQQEYGHAGRQVYADSHHGAQAQHQSEHSQGQSPDLRFDHNHGATAGRPSMQTTNTRSTIPQQRPVCDEQQSYSTSASREMPLRPSTASADSRPMGQSPNLNHHNTQPAINREYDGQVSKPGHHAKSSSLSEMYADYYGSDLIQSPEIRSYNREAEIEAEMPDFDNVEGPPNAHRRGLTIDQHLDGAKSAEAAPPMPSMPKQFNQPNGFYQQGNQTMSQPSLKQVKPIPPPIATGFDFGVPPSPSLPPGSYSNPTSPEARAMPTRPFPGPQHQNVQQGQQGQQRQQYVSDDPRQRGRPNVGMASPQESSRFNGPMSPPQRPDVERFNSGQTMRTDPRSATRAPSAPAQSRTRQQPTPNGGMMPNGSPMLNDGPPIANSGPMHYGASMPNGAPAPQQRSVPPPQPRTQSQPRPQPAANPDALPSHPAPFRPGLMNQSPGQPARPPPVRQYDNPPQAKQQTNHSSSASQSSIDSRRRSQQQPVTHAEINKLQAQVNAYPQDAKTALLLAKKLVEAGAVLASENGRLDARATAKNREKYILDAHRRVKKLVSQGYPEAMFYLADCYGQGELGLAVDTKEAFVLYQGAAKAGHAAAAYRTAVCCEMGPEEGGGTRRDVQKAVQWYRRAAQLQDVAGMFKLGMILLKGLLGQPRNIGESVTWLKRAAERADKANPHALHELALMYEPENDDALVKAKIISDEKYARELFFQAAGLGYKFSQFRLGQAYEYGALACPIDARSSIAWYSKAAAQGEHGAELALSGWYLTGSPPILEQSDNEAYLWARKAASAASDSSPSSAKAMFAMGYYTEMGIGCPANVEEAKKWYGRAAAYKFPKAMERLEEIKRGGGRVNKGGAGLGPEKARLTRNQRKDEAECALM